MINQFCRKGASMVQTLKSEQQHKTEKTKKDGMRLHKNGVEALGNGDKKVELTVSPPEGEGLLISLPSNKRLVQETVGNFGNVISIGRTLQIHQGLKEGGYGIQKEGTGDEDDQLFHGRELYDYKDTCLKIGLLEDDDQLFHRHELYDYKDSCLIGLFVQHYSSDPELLSEKWDEARRLLSQVCYLAFDGSSYSCLVTGQMNKVQSDLLAAILFFQFLHQAKDSANQKKVETLQEQQEHCHCNSKLKEIHGAEGNPEQGRDQKTPVVGSGYAVEKLAENTEQHFTLVKNSPLYESEHTDSIGKKNILYVTEGSYFNAGHRDMPDDHHASQEMVVLDQGHCRSVIVSRISQGQPPSCEEIIRVLSVPDSKTEKVFEDSEKVERKRPFRSGQSWIDRGVSIPAGSAGEMKVKQKEYLEDFEINGIDNNFPDGGDFKKGKNSFGLPSGRVGYEDYRLPDAAWMHVRLSPKLCTPLLSYPDPHARIMTSLQGQAGAGGQELLPSVSEELNPGEENHGEGPCEAASQSPSVEDSEQYQASSVEGGQAHDGKLKDAGGTADGKLQDSEEVSGNSASGEPQGTGEVTDAAAGFAGIATEHGKDTDAAGETCHHSGSVEGSGVQSVFWHTRISDGRSVGDETSVERGIGTEGAVGEAISLPKHDEQSKGRESGTADASSSVCVKKDVELKDDGCAEPHAVSHEIDNMPAEIPTALPDYQAFKESASNHETAQTFSVPIQVSSPGNSELDCAAGFEPCFSEIHEDSSVPSVCDEERRSDYRQNGHPVGAVQETQQSGRRSSVFAREEGCYFHAVSPAQNGSNLGVAEEVVYTFISYRAREEPSCASHCPIHQGASTVEEHPLSWQNGIQSQSTTGQQSKPDPPHDASARSETFQSHPSSAQSVSVGSQTFVSDPSPFVSNPSPLPPSQPVPVQSEGLPSNPPLALSGPGPQPSPVCLPPVTVHAASSLPRSAPRTARIDLSRAAKRDFAELRRRRATYGYDWPLDGHSGVDAANMALSGFYIVDPGGGRGVRCFYCGLELHSLTPASNIWDEHVWHSPNCRYLNAVMGSDFVQETLRKLREDRDCNHP